MRNTISIRKFWANRKIFLSGSAAICLFGVAPSKLQALIGILGLVSLMIACAIKDERKNYKFESFVAPLVTAFFDLLLVENFISVWSPSRQLAALAAKFHLSSKSFLIILGIIGGILAFNAICYAIAFIKKECFNLKIFDIQLVKDKQTCLENLKSNWYLPISAFAFFCLQIHFSVVYCLGTIIAFGCVIFISTQKRHIFAISKDIPTPLKIYALLSALGICYAGKCIFYEKCVAHEASILYSKIIYALSLLGAAVGLIFAFLFIVIILNHVWRKISESGIVKRTSRIEWLVYLAVFILFVGFSANAFLHSEAFYGTDYRYDIIYTSDSPALMKSAVELYITHSENDLRQPLFAVFAAPFTGALYFIASLLIKFLPVTKGFFFTITNAAQIVLLLIANILIADMMNLKKGQRICFFAVLCTSYTYLLSSIMMEQYIVAYFWLVLAIYTAKSSGKLDLIAFYGATGTLLTSAVIFPLYYLKKSREPLNKSM